MTARSRVHRTGVLLVLLLVFVPTSTAAAQEAPPTRLEGRVLAAGSGAPLPGVEVALDGADVRARSDGRGHYVLRGVPPGSATVSFRRLGYTPAVHDTDVVPGVRNVLDVRLVVEPIGLDPMVVHSRRTRMIGDPLNLSAITGSAHFLSREDLDARKLPHDDVHGILRRIPGVTVQDEEGYGLRPNIGMRGTGVSRSSKVTLMEDGVLIAPAPYAAPAAYYFPVAGRMEAIEVRKGSSQIRYGPRTIGGAINLVSSSIPERRSWEVDTQGGEDGMLKLRVRGGDSGTHFGWMAETYQLRTDGYQELEGRGDTGFRLRDHTLKLRANTGRDAGTYQELELKLGYHDEISDQTYLGLTLDDFRTRPLLRYAASAADRMDTEHAQVQLRHFVQPSTGLDLTTTAYHNTFSRNWYKLASVRGTGISTVLDQPAAHPDELAILKGTPSEPDALTIRANNREYVSQGVQTVLGVRLGEDRIRHDLELGVRAHRDEEDRFQWDDGYRMAGGVPVRSSEGEPGTQANRVGKARALSAYLQDEVRIGERWTVVPGVRYEHIELTRTDYPTDEPGRDAPSDTRTTTVSAVTPGLGAVLALAPGADLFGGVHRGFSPPGPGAAEGTRPEESLSWELGTRVRRAGTALQVVAFFNDYSNILGQATLATGESGAGDLFNGGSVQALGLETSIDHDLSWKSDLPVRLPASLAHTYSRATFRSGFASDFGPWGTVEEGDHLPYLPTHQLSGSVGVEAAEWSVTFTTAAATAMRTRAGTGSIPDDASTDAFVVLGLEGEHRLPGRLEGTVYGGVRNLADRRYVAALRPAGARPGLPRTLFAGVRIRY